MGKYEIIIKNKKDNRVIDTFECNKVIGAADSGNFCAGEFEFPERMSLLATLMETHILREVQDKNSTDISYTFDTLKSKYNKEEIIRIQNKVIDILKVLKSAIIDGLYEKTFKPEEAENRSEKFNIKAVNENGSEVLNKNTDFAILSCYGSGTSMFGSLTEIEDEDFVKDADFKLFQMVCNVISYCAKASLSLDLDDRGNVLMVDNLMKSGDDKMYNLFLEKIQSYIDSIAAVEKEMYLKAKMRTNNLDMIVDEEELYRQQAEYMIKEMMDYFDTDEDEESE